MSRRRERALDAYRDGQLSARERARVERWLSSNLECQQRVEQTDALGDLVRGVWTEGPPAPSPERLLAAIRPALRAIDTERAARRSWLSRLGLSGSPSSSSSSSPSIWEWISASGLVTASLIAVVMVSPPTQTLRREAQHVVALPGAGPMLPSSVYELADGGTPLTIYESDGATVIFFGPEPAGDDLSWGPLLEDWA